MPAATPPAIIQPPPSWVAQNLKNARPGPLGKVSAQWLNFSRGDEEFVELGARPSFGLTSDSMASYYRDFLLRSGNRIVSFRAERLCKSEMGWSIDWQEPLKYGGSHIEDIFFVDGRNVYFASYHYPRALTPLPAAERSIASLCIPSPASRPIRLPVHFDPPAKWLIQDPSQGDWPAMPGAIAQYISPHRDQLIDIIDPSAAAVLPKNASAQTKAVQQHIKPPELVNAETSGLQALCNDADGLLGDFTMRFGKQSVTFVQMTIVDATPYIALYMRPAGTRALPEAMNSLHTLCPLQAPATETPSASPAPSPSPSGSLALMQPDVVPVGVLHHR